MKKFKTSVLVLLLAVSACKKTDDSSISLTNAEAVDLVATTLAVNSSGVIAVSADVTVSAQAIFDLNIGCGNTKSYMVTHSSPSGSAITHSNTFSYNYTLNCNANNIPDNVTGTSTDKGTFDGPRISSTNSGASTFKVAGLTPIATVYVVNGTYKRTGTFTSKVDSKNTSTTNVEITLTNLVINKTTKAVTSGTATVSITGSTSKKAEIKFAGNLTFTGDGKASVTINGTLYVVDLLTGDFVKK